VLVSTPALAGPALIMSTPASAAPTSSSCRKRFRFHIVSTSFQFTRTAVSLLLVKRPSWIDSYEA
jgi:hypothetical protein